jgi:hypothetical protein
MIEAQGLLWKLILNRIVHDPALAARSTDENYHVKVVRSTNSRVKSKQ